MKSTEHIGVGGHSVFQLLRLVLSLVISILCHFTLWSFIPPPQTPQYVLLKKIGGLFPGPSKTTRAYLHPEESVREALASAGFKVKRSTLTATNFYFSTLFEAVRV